VLGAFMHCGHAHANRAPPSSWLEEELVLVKSDFSGEWEVIQCEHFVGSMRAAKGRAEGRLLVVGFGGLLHIYQRLSMYVRGRGDLLRERQNEMDGFGFLQVPIDLGRSFADWLS